MNKVIILGLMSVVTISGCGSDNIQQPVSNGLTSNETVSTESLTKDSPSFKVYRGKFPNGDAYQIWGPFSDGTFSGGTGEVTPTGDIGGYGYDVYIACSSDPITDRFTCDTSVSFDRTKATLDLTSNGFEFPYKLCIREHDYPDKIATIRFNDEKPVSLGTSGCTTSKTVISKVFTADVIAARYSEWPYINYDFRAKAEGTKYYKDLLNYMNKLYTAHYNQ